MAAGDFVLFNTFKEELAKGNHAFGTDTYKMAICDNTTAPTAATATPALGDFTQVGTAGTYVAGGTTLTITVAESSGTVTVDATNSPTWAQHASNDTDAYWAIIYNDTDAGDIAVGYVDLGGPVDMSANDLTINPHANGLFTF